MKLLIVFVDCSKMQYYWQLTAVVNALDGGRCTVWNYENETGETESLNADKCTKTKKNETIKNINIFKKYHL